LEACNLTSSEDFFISLFVPLHCSWLPFSLNNDESSQCIIRWHLKVKTWKSFRNVPEEPLNLKQLILIFQLVRNRKIWISAAGQSGTARGRFDRKRVLSFYFGEYTVWSEIVFIIQ
jgi:hypothetical protein